MVIALIVILSLSAFQLCSQGSAKEGSLNSPALSPSENQFHPTITKTAVQVSYDTAKSAEKSDGRTSNDCASNVSGHSISTLLSESSPGFSLRLGGSGVDIVNSVDIDSEGYIYATGSTESSDFPVHDGLGSSLSGGSDCFVVKLTSDGSSLVYSTLIGGTGNDEGTSICVDDNGSVYVAGDTDSIDFPVTNSFWSTLTGGVDIFVCRIDPSGTSLLYSTYIGGSGNDFSPHINVDSLGQVQLACITMSQDFPTKNSFDNLLNGTTDVVALGLSQSGNELIYSTYLGGSGSEYSVSCTVDTGNKLILAGDTTSSDFPTVDAIDATYNGALDCYLSTLQYDSHGLGQVALIFSTYIGGSDADSASAIALDTQGAIYLTGFTFSSDFPQSGSLGSSAGGAGDCFVIKIDATDDAFSYSYLIGGSGDDRGAGIAVSVNGTVYAVGQTMSNDFPGLGGTVSQPRPNKPDCFVIGIDRLGGSLLFSGVFGGTQSDRPTCIALTPSGSMCVAGFTDSPDFPITQGTPPPSSSIDIDGFILTLMKVIDSDQDGLTDLEELSLGTNPLLADSDGDGLSDLEEFNLGTNPLSTDTDGDSISDPWEIEHGFDPLDPNVPYDEYVLFMLPNIVLAISVVAVTIFILELLRRKRRRKSPSDGESLHISAKCHA